MMIQVGTDRNLKVSTLQKDRKTADSGFDAGFTALLERRAKELSESGDQKEEAPVSGQKEPEQTDGSGQESRQPETGDILKGEIPAAGQWLVQESLASQLLWQGMDTVQEGGFHPAVPPGEILPGQMEAVSGMGGEQKTVQGNLQSAGELSGAADTGAQNPADAFPVSEKGIPVLKDGQEKLPQDGLVSQEPEGENILSAVSKAEPESSRPAGTGEETGADQEGSPWEKRVSSLERQKETPRAAAYSKAETGEGPAVEMKAEIPSYSPVSRPHGDIPVRMPTSRYTMVRDTAEMLISRTPFKDGVLEVELEPASLGKLTIRVAVESGRTAVTVFSSNSETLEILSRNASQLAQILEERTGQQTIVYTPQSSETGDGAAKEQNGSQNSRQNSQDHKKERGESFAQQLRLGLVQV